MQQATFKAAAWLALVWEALLVGMVWGQTSAEKVKVDLTAEPLLEQWSVGKATEYLDSRANRDEGTKCLNCHGTFAYLLARPHLPAPGPKHAERRAAAEQWAAGLLKEPWPSDVTGEKPVDRKVERRITEALLTATVLAQHDAITTGKCVARRGRRADGRPRDPQGHRLDQDAPAAKRLLVHAVAEDQ